MIGGMIGERKGETREEVMGKGEEGKRGGDRVFEVGEIVRGRVGVFPFFYVFNYYNFNFFFFFFLG